MPKYIYYDKRGIERYLVAPNYSRYSKYILTSSSTKYNIYSPSDIKQRILEKTEKKLADKQETA